MHYYNRKLDALYTIIGNWTSRFGTVANRERRYMEGFLLDILCIVGEVLVEKDEAHEFGEMAHVETHLVLAQFTVELHHPTARVRGREGERERFCSVFRPV